MIEKKAFLQGESYYTSRNVICQLPLEVGYPAHIGARLKRPAYGLNDAPRRWWNRLDSALRSHGMIPTRADCCCYVYHSRSKQKPGSKGSPDVHFDLPEQVTKAIESLTDPITGSPSHGKTVSGAICLHVDNIFSVWETKNYPDIVNLIRKKTFKSVPKTPTMSCW